MQMINGSEWVKRLLQADMKRHGFTYATLTEKLNAIGEVENERNLRNKINRGNFSASFMVLCYIAMGLPTIRVFDPETIPPIT